jgi:hypothetical protein
MNYDVPMRVSSGEVLSLPEKWATLLAEETLRVPSVDQEAAVSAARKIELRLTGEETSPVDFDQDERIEILETLNAVCTGWHKSQGGEWETSDARAFYRAFAAS